VNTHATATESHDKAWELLPWVVNGRLAESDQAWVAQHIEECADCRREIEAQEQIQAALASDARVEYAPSASFQKLVSRIDELERQVPGESPGEMMRVRPPRTPLGTSRLPRWLVVAVAAQGVMVVALAVLAGRQSLERLLAPRFQTLTSAQAPATLHGNLRVVLAPAVTVAEFQSLLESVDAKIVAGPSEARVWTLSVPFSISTHAFDTAIKRLRADARVVLAEPTTGEDGHSKEDP
jgi:Putative zinc-finger